MQLRINEAVGDHFLVAFVVQHGFHTLQRQIGLAMAAHHQTRLHRLVRDVVVAVNAGHFFHQIFLDLHVKTPGRRNGFPLVLTLSNFAAQTRQNVGYLRIGNVVTNQTIQFAAAQGNGRTLRQRRFVGHINYRTRFAAADVDQEASRTLHRFVLQRRIHATLVAVRSISVQTVTACAAGDGERAEERAFQQDVLRLVVNARVLAAEDPAHRQRFVVIGNHQGVSVQFRFAAVQQNQGFALFRHAHDDPTFDTIFIKGVHWLAQLQQNIVGDVDDCIDRTDTAATQFLFHPQRGWRFNVNTFHHTTEVAWAGLRRVYLYRQHVTDGCLNRNDLRHVQFSLVQHGHVAGHTDDA